VAIQSFANPRRRTILLGRAALEERRLGERGEGGCQEARYARLCCGVDRSRLAAGHRLEALKGKLAGGHSIRINDQWRVVFRWTDSGPAEVDIRDYH
jgi:Txe/YoeB family toxin of Txe-Axe toxin-antitoxin module